MIVIALTVLFPDLFAQVEIKGAGSTSATVTFLTKNSNSDTSLLVRDDGRIGIGTSSPTTKLDVNGLVYARNGIQFPDGTIQLSGFPGTTMIPRVFTVAASGANFTTITAAINANVYDIITRSAAGNAQGNFNTNSNGLVIGP